MASCPTLIQLKQISSPTLAILPGGRVDMVPEVDGTALRAQYGYARPHDRVGHLAKGEAKGQKANFQGLRLKPTQSLGQFPCEELASRKQSTTTIIKLVPQELQGSMVDNRKDRNKENIALTSESFQFTLRNNMCAYKTTPNCPRQYTTLVK